MIGLITAVLLAVHLALVDLAMIGPLASVWLDWRATRRAEPEFSEFGRQLAVWTIASLILGGVVGGLLLWIRYAFDERYFRAVAAVPTDRLWFAGAEFIFSLLCLGVYVGLWRRWKKGRIFHRLVAVAAASNLMMHFPALFAVISIIGSRPGLIAQQLDRAGFRRMLIDGEVVSRVVHVWLAAVAVTGVAVIWLGLRNYRTDKGTADSAGKQVVKMGARLALAGTILQFPVGLWVALRMPENAREPLMGGDALASLLFLASVGLAMALMHVLSPLALGEPTTAHAWRVTAVISTLMLLMVGTRLRVETCAAVPHRAETEATGARCGAMGPCVDGNIRFNRGTFHPHAPPSTERSFL